MKTDKEYALEIGNKVEQLINDVPIKKQPPYFRQAVLEELIKLLEASV